MRGQQSGCWGSPPAPVERPAVVSGDHTVGSPVEHDDGTSDGSKMNKYPSINFQIIVSIRTIIRDLEISAQKRKQYS